MLIAFCDNDRTSFLSHQLQILVDSNVAKHLYLATLAGQISLNRARNINYIPITGRSLPNLSENNQYQGEIPLGKPAVTHDKLLPNFSVGIAGGGTQVFLPRNGDYILDTQWQETLQSRHPLELQQTLLQLAADFPGVEVQLGDNKQTNLRTALCVPGVEGTVAHQIADRFIERVQSVCGDLPDGLTILRSHWGDRASPAENENFLDFTASRKQDALLWVLDRHLNSTENQTIAAFGDSGNDADLLVGTAELGGTGFIVRKVDSSYDPALFGLQNSQIIPTQTPVMLGIIEGIAKLGYVEIIPIFMEALAKLVAAANLPSCAEFELWVEEIAQN